MAECKTCRHECHCGCECEECVNDVCVNCTCNNDRDIPDSFTKENT